MHPAPCKVPARLELESTPAAEKVRYTFETYITVLQRTRTGACRAKKACPAVVALRRQRPTSPVAHRFSAAR